METDVVSALAWSLFGFIAGWVVGRDAKADHPIDSHTHRRRRRIFKGH